MSRAERKRDHIQHALSTDHQGQTAFDDIVFVHHSLPNTSVEDVRLQTKIGELTLSSPIFINAMTGGGGENTQKINQELAIAARETGIAIAVGSQMAAIKDPSERKTFEIVRKTNPNGVVLANIGSEASVSQALEVVEMIDADALQIHLNVIQELAMPEGDRSFQGALERISAISTALPIPVIVKETGFGMSAEAVSLLDQTEVTAVDVGGFGGTNFSKIENARRKRLVTYFDDWGIPTPISIIEARSSFTRDVIASGGIQTALDVIKSVALGAKATGMAGTLLKVLVEQSLENLLEEIQGIHEDLAYLMCALGVTKIEELLNVPMVISGESYHWLKVRGYKPETFARRN
ncbi:type 2 isopentenyl-diphosphate Delta-isomerase [Bacillus sp. 2205SS5-2]|uniref:type 2 isopentenyl-diphosphate Delta-isomerase n=1 Tax=Bacillus sp. 2205SS5-2 TaxID=3109031 RepID=UPI003007E5A7